MEESLDQEGVLYPSPLLPKLNFDTEANADIGLIFVSTVFAGITSSDSDISVAVDERTAFYHECAFTDLHLDVALHCWHVVEDPVHLLLGSAV
ncbi:hypothetical protein GN244_ATG00848 [Phytophthora infestans]|uniref:Uncharacterized protein n=1 Tax=Phytophthora infestans TaxID=4787 RepID=A0A833X2B0_PHYIN|nr:hypothetical protein GN244_ATG00848 [Phytophthora infestans]